MDEEVVSKDRLVAEVLTIKLAPSQEVATQPPRFDHLCLSRTLQGKVDALIFYLRKIHVSLKWRSYSPPPLVSVTYHQCPDSSAF